MLLTKLHDKGLIDPPKFLMDNTHYLCRMGSEAYGASLGAGNSDVDVVGFVIPKMEDIFPYKTSGYVLGFGKPPNPFQQWSKHHVKDGTTEYDLTVYSIVKFFHLAMENNPNMLDTLFVPDRCVIHATEVGKIVRDNRKIFLHKGSMQKLRGYAFSQMKKIREKTGSSNEKRQATINDHGFDTKNAYHVARLTLQAEQILTEGDLTLDRNSQLLLSIRRGEWTFEHLEEWFHRKEASLEEMYGRSSLQYEPDVEVIRSLLIKCLEQHYGSLSAVVEKQTDLDRVLREMQDVINRYEQ